MRSLAPKEHGAYGQLGLPLFAALASRTPNLAALCLGGAGVLAFMAHEPLLILAGHRGGRALREDGARARRRLFSLGGSSAALGAIGLALAPSAVWIVTLLPLTLAAIVAWLIHARIEKTALGEMLVAAALSSVGVLASVAANAPVASALVIWGAWCVTFAAMTMSVRTIITNARQSISALRRVAVPLLLALASVALVAAEVIPVFIVLAFVPVLILALALAIRPPSPRQLRRVGWSLVGATSFAAVMLAIGFHTGQIPI